MARCRDHCCSVRGKCDLPTQRKPTNETLLWIAFGSFVGFASAQCLVAFIANSSALLGDAAAMYVDALAYGFNIYAERMKSEDDGNGTNHSMGEIDNELSAVLIEYATKTGLGGGNDRLQLIRRQLQARRRHLYLELVPPLMSVSILLSVIGFVLYDSIQTLILSSDGNENDESEPNLLLMLAWSILNLVLDLVNVACFARANHLMGYSTDNRKGGKIRQKCHEVDGSEELNGEEGYQYEVLEPRKLGNGNSNDQHDNAHHDISSNESVGSEDSEEDHVNLNMCSAYTHVFADTLRTISVIIVTVVAQAVESITPKVADATATVIVSAVILASVLPLIRGLFLTVCELRLVDRLEQALGDNANDI